MTGVANKRYVVTCVRHDGRNDHLARRPSPVSLTGETGETGATWLLAYAMMSVTGVMTTGVNLGGASSRP